MEVMTNESHTESCTLGPLRFTQDQGRSARIYFYLTTDIQLTRGQHARPGPSGIVRGNKDPAKTTYAKMDLVERSLVAKAAHAKSQSGE